MNQQKTKIIATVGPASSSPKTIEQMMRQGVSVFRLNFSHGTHQIHAQSIKTIRTISKKLAKPVAIMADLQGPKIRTGETAGNKPVYYKKNSIIRLTTKHVLCTTEQISVYYRGLISEVSRDDVLLLNDGKIRLKVLSINKKEKYLSCLVQDGGTITSHKGVNFPGIPLKVQSVTIKDKHDLDFILANDINIIAQSFVRTKKDLNALNYKVDKSKKCIKIIAKIEKPEALCCLPDIFDSCDGIMVARGDLGVETSLWEVPVLQKRFIAEANQRGKLVIVATQMLESMIQNNSPTRAETADVANAIFDGTDAVMLSGETAVGAYPIKAVESMRLTAKSAERSEYYSKQIVDLNLRKHYAPHSVCEAAAWASRDMGGALVIVFTQSGDTALYMSKIRNQSPIYAFSPSRDVVNMLSIAWNVTSFEAPFQKDLPALTKYAEQILLDRKLVKKGSTVITISGTTALKGATNVMRIKKIGEI